MLLYCVFCTSDNKPILNLKFVAGGLLHYIIIHTHTRAITAIPRPRYNDLVVPNIFIVKTGHFYLDIGSNIYSWKLL